MTPPGPDHATHLMMMRRIHGSLLILAASLLVLALGPACGGGSKQGEAKEPGERHSKARGADEATEGGDEGEAGEGEATAEGESEGETEEGTTEEGPPPAVTFVLKNSDEALELAFNMDLGWQPNLFAYRGKPPKAVSILMFPKFCTESCDMAASQRCPTCEQPEGTKDILAAQKMEKVAPGEELEVPWDGQMFVYEKTRARKTQCECHRTEAAPAGTYTVKACGLRLTTTAEERSRLQCAEARMKLPSEEPQRVELDFGAAPAAPSAHKSHSKKKRH
jgi:hypothetical protein